MRLCQIMFEADDIIVKTDQTYQGPFLIEDGKVDIYHIACDRNIVAATFGNGEIFSDTALVDEVEHVRYVQAREQTSCLVISAEQYRASTKEKPPAMRLLLARIGAQASAHLGYRIWQIDPEPSQVPVKIGRRFSMNAVRPSV